MQKKIYKYPLEVADINRIKMPVDAEILTIQVQGDVPCLWALVDPTQPEKEYIIEMYGTGHPIECSGFNERKYISSFQLYGGGLVYHAFNYLGI